MAAAELERKDRFVISPAVKSRQLDDELILLDLRGGEYFSLNASGAQVWRGIEQGWELGVVDDEISSQWPVTASERWAMLTEIVGELLERGFLERR